MVVWFLSPMVLEFGDGPRVSPCRRPARIVKEVADELLVGAQERIDLRDARHENADGADQGERGEPARVAYRKLGRDPAAEVVADEMDVGELELVEQVEIEAREDPGWCRAKQACRRRQNPDAPARSRREARRGRP